MKKGSGFGSLAVVVVFGVVIGCGGSDGEDGSGGGGGEAVEVDPGRRIEVGGCEAQGAGEMPEAAGPRVEDVGREYTIELERWGISGDGRAVQETTDGLNEAIEWARGEGYGTVRLPAGRYLVGEKINGKYSGAIKLPGGIHFALDDEAVIEMDTNDSWNYCVIDVKKKEDVIITGGTIRGDRESHDYAGGGAHDEGHAICVWGGSKRVLIEGMTLTETTGDGVLIVASKEESSRDITIRGNEIFNNRRQGVSIVGGINVVIEDNEIHHIHGTAPQFGIDIESKSYTSKDILIRKNHFYQNQGGDYVNTDGRNVWLIDNIMDQTGLEKKQTDGPIVHWSKTDQVIRGNTITVTVGSSNGRWGLIGYRDERKNPVANIIEDNVFYGGGLHMANTTRLKVSGNIIHDYKFLGSRVECLQFDDNQVLYDGREPYKFRDTFGLASGNQINGEPKDLALSPDEPFTNSPPHMW